MRLLPSVHSSSSESSCWLMVTYDLSSSGIASRSRACMRAIERQGGVGFGVGRPTNLIIRSSTTDRLTDRHYLRLIDGRLDRNFFVAVGVTRGPYRPIVRDNLDRSVGSREIGPFSTSQRTVWHFSETRLRLHLTLSSISAVKIIFKDYLGNYLG